MQRYAPEGMRRINDIAISGNGESTSAAEFPQVIELVAQLKHELELPPAIKLVLITNGSLLHRKAVQQGLRHMALFNGEVWFKLDRASTAEMQRINNTNISLDKVRENLATSIRLCPTWLQTCWFALDGAPPSSKDEDDYLAFLSGLLQDNIRPHGVLLYTLARPSMQPEAPRLSALSAGKMEAFAERIRALKVETRVSA